MRLRDTIRGVCRGPQLILLCSFVFSYVELSLVYNITEYQMLSSVCEIIIHHQEFQCHPTAEENPLPLSPPPLSPFLLATTIVDTDSRTSFVVFCQFFGFSNSK